MPRYRQDELAHIEQAYVTGRELVDAGMLEDALPYFDQVLVRLPRRRAGRVYRVMSPESARPRTDDAIRVPSVFRDALIAKAYCLSELGRFDDVFTLLERAVELDPENPQIYAELGFAHGAQDHTTEARAAYQTALRLEPDNPSHLCALAHLALMDDKFGEARALARRALKIDPGSVAMLNHLAYAEYRLGNMKRAIAALEKAVKRAPDDFESVSHLVSLLREIGHVRKAIQHLSVFLTHDPQHPEALGMMTDLLLQDGRSPEVFAHAERILARNPNDPVAYELLAWGAYQRGEHDKAIAALRRLIYLEPLHAYHHVKLGMLYQTLGKLTQAMASLQRAVAIDGGGEVSAMALEAISNLDQVQIEHVVARAELDPAFRRHLQRNPLLALQQAGFLLSPAGLHILQSIDFADDGAPWNMPSPTIH